MGGLSIWHILIVLAVVLVVFGSRLPQVMGDLGKGIKSFKSGLNDEKVADKSETPPPPTQLPPSDKSS